MQLGSDARLVPAVAALWQLHAGLANPSWAVRCILNYNQSVYLGNFRMVVSEILWRPSVMLQYMAFLSAPLVFLSMIVLGRKIRSGQGPSSSGRIQHSQTALKLLLFVFALYIIGGLLYGHFVRHLPLFMPILEWNLGYMLRLGTVLRAGVTVFTSLGAAVFACVFVIRYLRSDPWRNLPSHQKLLDVVTLFFLLLQLSYFYYIADEYLLPFLPFTLIVVGRYCGELLNRFRHAAAVLCLLFLIFAAIPARYGLARGEARWKAAEFARASGAEPGEIYSSWEWCSYYLFPRFLAETGGSLDKEPFYYSEQWFPALKKRARYLVTENPNAPAGEQWEIHASFPYRDFLFRRKEMYLVKRIR